MRVERPILYAGPMVRAILDGRKTQTRRLLKARLPEDLPDKSVLRMCLATDPVTGWVIPGPSEWWENEIDNVRFRCPYGKPGDHLWVRETFWINHMGYQTGALPKIRPDELRDGADAWSPNLLYLADGTCCDQLPECECATEGKPRWRPSIHMPRWASRITLEVTRIRIERLQEISEADAWAEGCAKGEPTDNGGWFPAEEPDPSGVGTRGWDCARDWYADLWESINGEGSWEKNPWVWVVEFKRVMPKAGDGGTNLNAGDLVLVKGQTAGQNGLRRVGSAP